MNVFRSPLRCCAALIVALVVAMCGLAPLPALAQAASPHAIDIPRWFSETFLDFKEDVAEASRSGKRLLIYFGQDGTTLVLLLVGGSNGTQEKDIRRAEQYWRDYLGEK